MSAGVVLLFLLVGLGGALVLFTLVRSEGENRQSMDRTSAEKAARRDTRDEDRNR